MARTTKSRLGYLPSMNFPGSSGYWASDGSGATGSPGAGASIPGYGRPGDVALGNVPNPNSRGSQVGVGGGVESLYQPLQITKSPLLAAGTQDLMKAFQSGADSIPGYSELLDQARNISGNFGQAYNRINRSLDLGSYAAGQRGADSAAANLTGRFGEKANDILGLYAQNDRNYAGDVNDIIARAYGMLPEYDAAATAIGDDQLAKQMGQISRYKIAGGNLGVGTDELRKIARSVANVELPLEQQRIQRMYDVLTGVELPSQRELANRESTRLTNLELPVARDLYGMQQGDIMRAKQTESQLKQLEMTTAGMSMQAARDYLQSLALPAEMIQRVLQSKNQTLAGQIANLSGIGQLDDAAYYRGLNYTPGASLAQPIYFNNSLPPLPSMAPTVGQGGGVMNFNGGPVNPNSTNWRDWSPAQVTAETNRLRSLPPAPTQAELAYQMQTGFLPKEDPNFSQFAYNRIVSALNPVRDPAPAPAPAYQWN